MQTEPVTPTFTQTAPLLEQDEALTDDLAEILQGLARPQKALSPKFFYDERGSALFDAICELPEYYPTRTELQIMRSHIDEIADRIGPRAGVIEFGSGSSLKTRILLEHLASPAAYIPVDISRDHLVATADSLAQDFPDLEVLPVAADFTHPFPLPSPRIPPDRHLVYFPGSTIGNFAPPAAGDVPGSRSRRRPAHWYRPEEGRGRIASRVQRQRGHHGAVQPESAATPEQGIRGKLRVGSFPSPRHLERSARTHRDAPRESA
jgi:hypothetical protein